MCALRRNQKAASGVFGVLVKMLMKGSHQAPPLSFFYENGSAARHACIVWGGRRKCRLRMRCPRFARAARATRREKEMNIDRHITCILALPAASTRYPNGFSVFFIWELLI